MTANETVPGLLIVNLSRVPPVAFFLAFLFFAFFFLAEEIDFAGHHRGTLAAHRGEGALASDRRLGTGAVRAARIAAPAETAELAFSRPPVTDLPA